MHAAKPTAATTDWRDAEAGDDNADKLAPDPALIATGLTPLYGAKRKATSQLKAYA